MTAPVALIQNLAAVHQCLGRISEYHRELGGVLPSNLSCENKKPLVSSTSCNQLDGPYRSGIEKTRPFSSTSDSMVICL